ncbi:uncharacterized protein LOC129750692 isoform X2 [Uranotaenia lowii]|uniref:uncharacterized protein LOC129750692 isoform X2 n=1 Tax=Uranotaenia lowii TaxID=190385 RepID=UPI0024794E72|nr:uncharacterized protein LOC129750692 isoform X2 [Uranotaenia lowii]
MKVEAIDYDIMIQKLKDRLDKDEPNMASCHAFDRRKQGKDEPAENFILAVKLMAEECGFGAYKDTAIRNRIVFGLRDEELQFKLWSRDDYTLEDVERIVVRSELAKLRVESMREGGDVMRSINSVKYRLGDTHEGRFARDDYQHSNSRNRFPNRNLRHSWDRNRVEFNNARRGRYSDNFRSRFDNRERSYQNRFFNNEREMYPYRRGSRMENSHANVVCNFCRMKGHVKRNCTDYAKRRQVNFVEQSDESYDFKRLRIRDSEEEDDDEDEYPCMMISTSNKSGPCQIKALIENRAVHMEIDCGAAVSVINYECYRRYFEDVPLIKCNSRLTVVSGQRLNICGEIWVSANVNNIKSKARLIVLAGSHKFLPLLGRNWLDIFFPNWRQTFSKSNVAVNAVEEGLDSTNKLGNFEKNLKSKYPKIFDGDFSKPILGHEADLVLKDNQPIYKKAYEVPYKLKEKVVSHLDFLEQQNIITPIATSEWASPIIIVPKKNDDIRMVIDCKEHLQRPSQSIKDLQEAAN